LMTHYLRYEGSVHWTCALMFRKNALIKVGGFEEDFRGLYEDQVFYAKMALNYPIYVDENLLSKYRKHEDSACYQAEKTGYYNPRGPNKAALVFIQWLYKYISKNEIKDKGLQAALKKKLVFYKHPYLWRIIEVREKYNMTWLENFIFKQKCMPWFILEKWRALLANIRKRI
jgi:hypothetical protein